MGGGRPARISKSTLQLSRYDGGSAVVHFCNYWMSAQFDGARRLMANHPFLGIYKTQNLFNAPETGLQGITYPQDYVIKLGKYIRMFDPYFPKQISRWCPLMMVPGLVQGWIKWAGKYWQNSGDLIFDQVITLRKLHPYEMMRKELGFPEGGLAALRYSQLAAVVLKFFKARGSLEDPGPLESFLMSGEGLFSKTTIVAKVYAKLRPTLTPGVSRMWDDWESDIGISISQEVRDTMWYQTKVELPSTFQRQILQSTGSI